jgi:hypothetical protein
MGNIIDSKCRNCNFEKTFKYGGNKFNYQTNCPVPAINLETGEFENVNYIIEINNPKYKSPSSANCSCSAKSHDFAFYLKVLESPL